MMMMKMAGRKEDQMPIVVMYSDDGGGSLERKKETWIAGEKLAQRKKAMKSDNGPHYSFITIRKYINNKYNIKT